MIGCVIFGNVPAPGRLDEQARTRAAEETMR